MRPLSTLPQGFVRGHTNHVSDQSIIANFSSISSSSCIGPFFFALLCYYQLFNFSMDSGPTSDSDAPSSSGFAIETANIGGETVGVIRLANFDIMEHIQTLRRRASEEKENKKKKKQPPSPPRGTPVNSLPNELLSYIFTLGSEAEEDDDEDDEDDEEEEDEYGFAIRRRRPLRRLPFKVLVSHICRRWRTVVIETSTLWTHLNFAEGPPFAKSRTWLERSKECALDIELDCTVDDDDEEEEEEEVDSDESDDLPDASSNNDVGERVAPEEGRDAQSGDVTAPVKTKARKFPGRVSPVSLPTVRDLILPHAWRWRIFELMVNDYQIMHGILSTLSSIPEATQLQVLRLYHYDDDDSDEYDRFRPPHLRQPFFAPFCGRAPNLVQLALWGVHVDWTACADNLLLQGLEELELAYHAKDVRPPYAIFARTLQRSPDLHILTLCASGPAGDPEDWPADAIELPSVKHLVLAFVEPPYASALMKRLVFPNLSTLALDFDAGDYSSFLAQLAQPPRPPTHLTTTTTATTIQRHALCHTLVDLKISGMQCTEAALAAFYAALGNLASLNLNCYHLPTHFFQLLFPHVRDDSDSDSDSDSDDKHSDDDSDGQRRQRRQRQRQHEGCYLPKLETLSTSGIDGAEICDLLRRRVEVPLKHVLMDSAADVDIDEEAWIRGRVETFDFFDGSDDEDDDDDDDPIITELVDEQEMEMGDAGAGAAFAAEGDGMPGEWVDEDEPLP